MIKTLYIRNFALIDELKINFENGLNILTGETGSGKSIIIGAIDIALGARAFKDQIKTGSEKAFIELTLNLDNSFPVKILETEGIETIDGNNLIISREIAPSSTKSRINGALVTQNYIQALRKYLLDIHTQHESYNYINSAAHIELLDSYGQTDYGKLLNDYTETFRELKTAKKELEKAQVAAQNNAHKIDFLNFQIDEIKKANIENINEYEELLNKRSVLVNAQELKELTLSGYSALYGEDKSITDSLSLIQNKLSKASQFDEKLTELTEIIASCKINLAETAKELRNYSENLETDPQKLYETEERIEILEKIKKKYGPELSNALENLENFEAEFNEINFSDEKIVQLSKLVEDLEQKADKQALELSDSRKKLAEKLSLLIQEELIKLEMPKSKFYINVESGKELGINGYDNVEFLISTNTGESLKSLAKIASGGEISRIMLAIKSIFARSDKVNTVIFDEIDAGISGKTSQAVAEALSELAISHQIVCITHQPIIAAKADRHIYIQKTYNETSTKISTSVLNGEERLKALAGLASGSEEDEDSLNFVRKLLSQAKN
ncbi:MAG TPA: DNA repair protein RecN [Candidatus Gastranaerophilales bacterium]|nr:DNA repair protein RecN [Candidatus Gastranaerophilales bacterium]